MFSSIARSGAVVPKFYFEKPPHLSVVDLDLAFQLDAILLQFLINRRS